MTAWASPLAAMRACAASAALVVMPAVLAPMSAVQGAPKAGARVSVVGCPYAGVTASCLMIKGGDGAVYNITGGSPKPRSRGRMIRLRGTVTDKVSMCNEGIVLDRIRWTRTRQKCLN